MNKIARTIWDSNVRILHWVIAATAVFQLFSSIWMPDQGTQFLFSYHRIIGVVAALALIIFWVYSYAVYDFKILFPWGKESRREVKREFVGLFKRQLPISGRRIGLSGFIHGLGILAMTGCAYSGIMIFTMIPPGHVGPPADPLAFTHYSIEHKFFADLLWVYLFGHVAFALIHQFAGDNVFSDIFGTGGGKTENTEEMESTPENS